MLEAATSAPWVYMNTDAFFGEIRTVDSFTLIAETPDGDDRTPDFELIVALRNFAPALLDALEAAEELRKAAFILIRTDREMYHKQHPHLEAALAKYDNATKGLIGA